MKDIDALDESPIGSQGEEASNGSYKQSESSEEEEMFDSETFKGSFLQEMEKLSRPLKYERVKHNIYAHQDQTSQDNILAFIQHEEAESKFSFELEQPQQMYIIDFANNEQYCTCKCHEKDNSHQSNRPKSLPKRKKSNDSAQIRQKELREAQERERPKKECQKTWISLSLKEYKMKIKRKLQQKR